MESRRAIVAAHVERAFPGAKVVFGMREYM
jgi:hypothetical protein